VEGRKDRSYPEGFKLEAVEMLRRSRKTQAEQGKSIFKLTWARFPFDTTCNYFLLSLISSIVTILVPKKPGGHIGQVFRNLSSHS
jgi:hypothetical protein